MLAGEGRCELCDCVWLSVSKHAGAGCTHAAGGSCKSEPGVPWKNGLERSVTASMSYFACSHTQELDSLAQLVRTANLSFASPQKGSLNQGPFGSGGHFYSDSSNMGVMGGSIFDEMQREMEGMLGGMMVGGMHSIMQQVRVHVAHHHAAGVCARGASLFGCHTHNGLMHAQHHAAGACARGACLFGCHTRNGLMHAQHHAAGACARGTCLFGCHTRNGLVDARVPQLPCCMSWLSCCAAKVVASQSNNALMAEAMEQHQGVFGEAEEGEAAEWPGGVHDDLPAQRNRGALDSRQSLAAITHGNHSWRWHWAQ
eukprot:1160222-Pelagomonas_calceolata.AAC.9